MNDLDIKLWDQYERRWLKQPYMLHVNGTVCAIQESGRFGYLRSSVILVRGTGLKDKNGVEIYEGDIIEEMMWIKWCEVQGGFQAHMSGYGGNDCMACGGDIFWWEIVSDPQHYEVIGNIYENPELLEAQS